MVRSIEQQYWALAQQHIQLWSKEVAVELGEEILRREQAKFEVGSGSVPNVAEAKEQLERFRLELVTATADVITTERQLRNIIGLKPADNRRIIPVTAPTEARLEPELGRQPRPDDLVPARHRPQPAAGPRRRASAPGRPQPAPPPA